MALSTTQFEQLKQKLATQRAERESAVVEEGKKADKFLSKSIPEQLVSVETLKEMPRALLDVAIKNPLKFVASAVAAPVDIARSLTGKQPINKEMPFVGKTFQAEGAEKIGDLYDKADKGELGKFEQLKALSTFAEVPLAATELFGAGQALKGAKKSLTSGVSSVRALNPTIKPSGEFLSNLVNTVKKGVSAPLKYAGEKTGLTRFLSKENVAPQAKTAFEETSKNLVKDYEDYYDMTIKQMGKAELDTALNKVGSEAGEAFNKVIKTRQNIGKKMGAELEKIGDVKSDIAESVIKFNQRLKDEAGLVFDKAKQGFVSLGKQSKMTSQEKGFLTKFYDDVKKLGNNPTVKELDAFLARVPKELDIYKNKNAITGTTHAESLVKNTLKNMRGAFDPAKNPAFKEYTKARALYSELSDFLDEGVGFLGKKTMSGDYAKDASILKSSVQSILNSGKKDFLLKLEKLSGYPAIRKSVIALQAMKDAGDFKGLSLLETMAGQGAKSGTFVDIPTSAKGLGERVLKYGLDKAGQIVGGTPKERTLRFIKDIKK